MTSQINHHLKSHSNWKATISLLFGVLSLIPFIFLGLIIIEVIQKPIPIPAAPLIDLILFPGAPLIALSGLIFGIKGLKSKKKNMAMVGIVFSTIGLLVSIIYHSFVW